MVCPTEPQFLGQKRIGRRVSNRGCNNKERPALRRFVELHLPVVCMTKDELLPWTYSLIRLILCFILHGNYFKKKLAIYHSISGKKNKNPNTVTSVYFYRFLIFCFLECKQETSKLNHCFCSHHFPCLDRHSANIYSSSTLKGKKKAFYFYKSKKNSLKSFCTECTKVEGTSWSDW